MFGLKWAVPQSLGQSGRDSGDKTQVNNRKKETRTVLKWLQKLSLHLLFSHPGGGACAGAAVQG